MSLRVNFHSPVKQAETKGIPFPERGDTPHPPSEEYFQKEVISQKIKIAKEVEIFKEVKIFKEVRIVKKRRLVMFHLWRYFMPSGKFLHKYQV